MALSLNLGSVGSFALSSEGDLVKLLQNSSNVLIDLDQKLSDLVNTPISKVPNGSVSGGFTFSETPSWKISRGVGVNLSVNSQASCKVSVLAPGATLFTYYTGEEAIANPVDAPKDMYYVVVEFDVSLSLAAGAAFSDGDLGVSGSVSDQDQFRIAHYYATAPAVLLGDAIQQAFSHFVMPFQAESIANLPANDYIDCEFTGSLKLGFGATFGFSKLLLGGLNMGEVTASASTPVAKGMFLAKPAIQVGAAFTFSYTHFNDYRVVVGRTAAGATLYLLHKKSSQIQFGEQFGIKLSANAKFSTDSSTLKSNIQMAATETFGTKAGNLLSDKIGSALDDLTTDVNNSVNKLLAKANGESIELELVQSRSHEDTALFIYNFDFSLGTGAYGVAMSGDYAKALSMPGVSLDPGSFVEQVYTRSAGVNLHLFNLIGVQDATTYIQKNEVTYIGGGTFEIRSSAGRQALSKIFGKGREADLYLIAQARNLAQTVTDLDVRLNVVFADTDDASAFGESQRTMKALGLDNVADGIQKYVARNPKKSVRLTLDIDAASLGTIDCDEYSEKNKPPAEPHLKDGRNYEQFVRSVAAIVGPVDTVATTFEKFFARYANWLAYNRSTTNQGGSTGPGNRLSDTGIPNPGDWPEGYPPADDGVKDLVAVYIGAGQQCMNICAAAKHILTAVPAATTPKGYQELVKAVTAAAQDAPGFPTYFLKPTIAAMVALAGVALEVDGNMPDPATAKSFAVSIKSVAIGAAAAQEEKVSKAAGF